MFTVSGRVINELVELTCAINFSLLFRFESRAQKSKTATALMLDGGKEEGRGRKGSKKEGALRRQRRFQFACKTIIASQTRSS